MKAKSMKIWAMLFVVAVLSMGLLMHNGCKKSEPAPTEASSEKTMEMKGHEGHDHAAMDAEPVVETASVIEQTTCPVMGGAIDKELFVEYKGKKVYFCCAGCEEQFNKEPEKYIAKLPQFKQ